MKRVIQLNVRIDRDTDYKLREIAELFACSQADVIAALVKRMHREIRVKANQTTMPTRKEMMTFPLLYAALTDIQSQMTWGTE